jgi:protein HOOK3
MTQHEHLNLSHQELKEAYAQKDSQLRSLEDSQDGHQESYIKDLKTRIEENETLIAQQEQQLDDHRVSKERQQRELISLRPAASRVVELEDEFKVMKSENESLTKKANMVDHYRGKLEILNAIDRENKSLRDRIDVLEGNLKEYDRVHDANERLQRTNKENEIRFGQYEKEIINLSATSNMYKEDARAKQAEIDKLKAQQASDELFIDDLQQQLIQSGNHAALSPDSPADGPRKLTLQEELELAPEPTPNYPLEISRLRAEISLLKSASAGTANATLRIDLEESERARDRLSKNLKDLTDEHAITHSQLKAVLATASTEKYVVLAIDEALKAGPLKLLTNEFYRDRAIAITRDLERKATEELKATKAKLADVQSELTSQYRELLDAKADCKLFSNLTHSCCD